MRAFLLILKHLVTDFLRPFPPDPYWEEFLLAGIPPTAGPGITPPPLFYTALLLTFRLEAGNNLSALPSPQYLGPLRRFDFFLCGFCF